MLQEVIDSQHFEELAYADAAGFLPDAWDCMETMANVIAASGMSPPKKTFKLRPEIPKSTEEKTQCEVAIGDKAVKLIWRT